MDNETKIDVTDTIQISVLNDLFLNKHLYHINTIGGYQGIPESEDEGIQGEYNEYFKIYRHPDMPENLFMKETWHTDSYGYDEALQSVTFVKSGKKTITVYE